MPHSHAQLIKMIYCFYILIYNEMKMFKAVQHCISKILEKYKRLVDGG